MDNDFDGDADGDVSVGGFYLRQAKLKFEQLTAGTKVAYQGIEYEVDKADPGGFVILVSPGRPPVVLFKTQVDDASTSIISADDARRLGILRD